MLLCLDFGNSNFKYAVFEGGRLYQKGTLPQHGLLQAIQNKLDTHSITKSILATVTDYDKELDKILKDRTQFHLLSAKGSRLNFSTASIQYPETIGADRLAVCVAIVEEQANTHRLVISLGSCITYNFIDIEKKFLGGSISPGVGMRYRSMHEHTHVLPLLSSESSIISPPLIGYDTNTNMHSGVLYGVAEEVDGIIHRYESIYGGLKTYITGGDMEYLLPHIKSRIFADLDLAMKGLRWLANENI